MSSLAAMGSCYRGGRSQQHDEDDWKQAVKDRWKQVVKDRWKQVVDSRLVCLDEVDKSVG